jgi:hypothetical protein
MKTALENLPVNTMNAMAPRSVMAEILLQPKRGVILEFPSLAQHKP